MYLRLHLIKPDDVAQRYMDPAVAQALHNREEELRSDRRFQTLRKRWRFRHVADLDQDGPHVRFMYEDGQPPGSPHVNEDIFYSSCRMSRTRAQT